MADCLLCKHCIGWMHRFNEGYTIFCRLHGVVKLMFDCKDYEPKEGDK